MRHSLLLSVLVPVLISAAPAASADTGLTAAPRTADAWAGDPMVEKALGRIATVEAAEKVLAAGDKKKAETLINQLGWATKRLNSVSDQTTSEWKAAKKRHDAVLLALKTKRDAGPKPAPTPAKGAYDHEKLVKLNQSVGSAHAKAKDLQVKYFLDANRVNGMKKEVAAFRETIKSFPADHQNVQLVAGNIDALETLIEAGVTRVAADRAAAPGIEKQLDTLLDKYSDEHFPTRIEAPYREGQLRAWAAELHLRRTVKIPADVAWLQSIAQNVAIKPGRVNSLYQVLTGTETRKLDESERFVVDGLNGFAAEGFRRAEALLQIDPKDQNMMQQQILGEGKLRRNLAMLRTLRHRAEMARILDKELEVKDAPNRDAQVAKMDLAMEHLRELAKVGLAEIRMPEAASTNEDLLKVAQETLAKDDYDVGEWKRLVISNDIREHKRREGWLDIDAVKATVTYYDYVWKEFYVTTAEEVDGEMWLFSHRMRMYESGDRTTPVGRWVLSQRFKMTPILAENVQK